MEQANLSDTEYERARAAQSIDVEISQQSRGSFNATLGMREAKSAVLYFSEFNLAFAAHLTPPRESFSLLAVDTPEGAILANGHRQRRDGMLVIPPHQSVDLVAPAATSADSITIPAHRFCQLADGSIPAS